MDAPGEERAPAAVGETVILVANTDARLKGKLDDTRCESDYASARTDMNVGTAELVDFRGRYGNASGNGHAAKVRADYKTQMGVENACGEQWS